MEEKKPKTPAKRVTAKKTTTSKNVKTTSKQTTPKSKTTKKAPSKASAVKTPNKTTLKKEIKETPKVIEEKTIPPKEIMKKNEPATLKLNKFAIITLALSAILVILVLCKTTKLMDFKDLSKSYLIKNKIVKNTLEQNNIANASNKSMAFVLVTSLNNEEEYKLEKDLKKVIEKNNIKDNFYIYIVTDETKEQLSNLFQIDDIKTPTILYYKNGSLVDYVKRNDEKMMEAADFAKLLDIYEIAIEED